MLGDDQRDEIHAEHWVIHREVPALYDRVTSQDVLTVGIKVIDLIALYFRGGQIGLLGGSGEGKTVIMELYSNVAMDRGGCFVFAGVGKRTQGPRVLLRDNRLGRDPARGRALRAGLRADERNRGRALVIGAHGAYADRVPGRALLRGQPPPRHTDGPRGVVAARPHSRRGGLPVEAGVGNRLRVGPHLHHQERLDAEMAQHRFAEEREEQ